MSARKNRLQKLKILVSGLSDRDIPLKNDAKLFANFFDNFPIPVTMWSIDPNGHVISKRGNTIICSESDCLKNLFHEEYSDDFIKAHEKALKGESVSFFSSVKKGTYYTRLIPNHDESGGLLTVTGVSWDITSNFNMLKKLEKILKMIKEGNTDLSCLESDITEVISMSRIKHLLPEGEK